MKKAVFLDRDGTINKDFGYVYDISKLELLPNVIQGIKKMQDKGYLILIISNQSGIGRGYYTIEQAHEFNFKLVEYLKINNIDINGIYICPHTDNNNCNCRKPKIGLFLQAIREHDIDIKKSYCFGDNIRDISGMITLGCKGALIGKRIKGFISFPNLYEAAKNFVD